MQDFLKANVWSLLVALITISVAWGVQGTRLTAVEARAQETQQNLAQYALLVERVIRLEENRQTVATDIIEIKEDLKDLKRHFEIPDNK